MSRVHFFKYRLAASAALLLLAYTVIRAFWYPGAYFGISDASKQFWMLAAVVIVAGPGLSTVVFRPGKKGLVMDLWILGGLEVAAVVAAMTFLYLRQPYFAVFAIDRFEAVPRQEVLDFDAAVESFGRRPAHRPRLVSASLPDDPERMNTLIDETVLMGMPDIDRRPEFWAPYASGVVTVKATGHPLSLLATFDEERHDAVVAWVAASKRPVDSFLFVPLRGKSGDATMIIDSLSGYPVATLAVDPWPSAAQDGPPAGDVEQAH